MALKYFFLNITEYEGKEKNRKKVSPFYFLSFPSLQKKKKNGNIDKHTCTHIYSQTPSPARSNKAENVGLVSRGILAA